jgi:hypothetical protein
MLGTMMQQLPWSSLRKDWVETPLDHFTTTAARVPEEMQYDRHERVRNSSLPPPGGGLQPHWKLHSTNATCDACATRCDAVAAGAL